MDSSIIKKTVKIKKPTKKETSVKETSVKEALVKTIDIQNTDGLTYLSTIYNIQR
jgi:hypothetical protein